jgi:hypothetical protein
VLLLLLLLLMLLLEEVVMVVVMPASLPHTGGDGLRSVPLGRRWHSVQLLDSSSRSSRSRSRS